jgi:hypothetical protein
VTGKIGRLQKMGNLAISFGGAMTLKHLNSVSEASINPDASREVRASNEEPRRVIPGLTAEQTRIFESRWKRNEAGYRFLAGR